MCVERTAEDCSFGSIKIILMLLSRLWFALSRRLDSRCTRWEEWRNSLRISDSAVENRLNGDTCHLSCVVFLSSSLSNFHLLFRSQFSVPEIKKKLKWNSLLISKFFFNSFHPPVVVVAHLLSLSVGVCIWPMSSSRWSGRFWDIFFVAARSLSFHSMCCCCCSFQSATYHSRAWNETYKYVCAVSRTSKALSIRYFFHVCLCVSILCIPVDSASFSLSSSRLLPCFTYTQCSLHRALRSSNVCLQSSKEASRQASKDANDPTARISLKCV